jgi:predicted peroxiredoxin
MPSVSIILRRPPYGTGDASEAIRHALGGITEDVEVKLILVDGGVNAAMRSQDVAGTPFSKIEDGIRDCIDMGVEVFVDKLSMKEQYLEADSLIDGVKIENSYEIAEMIKKSDTILIF